MKSLFLKKYLSIALAIIMVVAVVPFSSVKAAAQELGNSNKDSKSNNQNIQEEILVVKPETPTGLKATNHLDGVRFTWGSVDGAESYRVYRKYGRGRWKCIAVVKDNFYIDTEVKADNGKTYLYTVRAVNSAGSSSYENGVKITVIKAPHLLKAYNTDGGVKLQWEAVEGINEYRVYRKIPGGYWKYIGKTSRTYYADKKAKGNSGVKYLYTVRAYNNGYSAFESGVGVLVLSNPKLSKVENKTDGIKVTWEAVEGAELYRVYRKENGGKWQFVKETAANSFVDERVKNNVGKNYTYTVRAKNNKDLSGYDSGLNIKRIATPHLVKVCTVKDGVKVQWNGVKGVKEYRVYRKLPRGYWKYIGKTSGTSFVDKNIAKDYGRMYIYTVRAYQNCYSDFESGISITVLQPPVMREVLNKNNGMSIKWEEVGGALKYRVYRKENGGNWKYIVTVTGSSYLDETVKNNSGKNYTYTVRAENENSTSYFEDGLTTKRVPSPHLLSVSIKRNYEKITWEPVEKAESYVIYKKTNCGYWERITEIKATNENPCTYIGRNGDIYNGEAFTFTVRAKISGVYSGYEEGITKILFETPTVNKAIPVDNGIKICWDKVSFALKYNVYRQTNEGKWRLIGSTEGTSYLDREAVENKEYFYTVRAVNNDSISSFVSSKAIKRIESPVIKHVYNSEHGFTIEWEKEPLATGYEVYCKRPDMNWEIHRFTGDKTSARIHIWAGTGEKIEIAVVSKYNDTISEDIGTVHTYLDNISTNIVEYFNTKKGIYVRWYRLNGDFTYSLFKKTISGEWEFIKEFSQEDTLEYLDETVAPAQKTCYVVLNNSKNIDNFIKNDGDIVRVETTNNMKTSAGSQGITVSWEPVEKAESYYVYRFREDFTSMFPFECIGETKTTSFVDKDAVFTKAYQYAVRAGIGKDMGEALTQEENEKIQFITDEPLSCNSVVNFYNYVVGETTRSSYATAKSWCNLHKSNIKGTPKSFIDEMKKSLDSAFVPFNKAEEIAFAPDYYETTLDNEITNLNCVKSANLAKKGENYLVTIVLNEQHETHKENSDYFLFEFSPYSCLNFEELYYEIACNSGETTRGEWDVFYKDFTITAEVTPDGKIVNMKHSCKNVTGYFYLKFFSEPKIEMRYTMDVDVNVEFKNFIYY